MNDAEIIKGLECCRHSFCCDCPYEKYSENCTDKLITEAYHLVKRQQAEIKQFADIGKMYSEIKAEVIKDFADALKSKSELVAPSVYAVPYRAVSVDDIDKLVKIAGGDT